MQDTTVLTRNIRRLRAAVSKLEKKSTPGAGFGLLAGNPGEGKTTALAHVHLHFESIYISLRATWSARSFLQVLVREMGLAPSHWSAPMVEAATQKLIAEPKLLLIDEADYLLESPTLDLLRDLYDATNAPIVMAGSPEFARRILHTRSLWKVRRRIGQLIHFEGISKEDAKSLTEELAEVDVGNTLFERLYQSSEGNIGAFVIGLSNIEKLAAKEDLTAVTSEAYGSYPLAHPIEWDRLD